MATCVFDAVHVCVLCLSVSLLSCRDLRLVTFWLKTKDLAKVTGPFCVEHIACLGAKYQNVGSILAATRPLPEERILVSRENCPSTSLRTPANPAFHTKHLEILLRMTSAGAPVPSNSPGSRMALNKPAAPNKYLWYPAPAPRSWSRRPNAVSQGSSYSQACTN